MNNNLRIISISFMVLLSICSMSMLNAQTANDSKPHVAILDFEGRGITDDEAGSLTDRFRSKLVNTRIYTVLDRGNMEKIFAEWKFQMTGCTSTECAVEAGKLLAVRKIITGTIGKVGKTYTVVITLIDVELGEIEQSFNRDHSGSVEGLLPILEEIVGDMAQIKGMSKTPVYVSGITALASIGLGTFSIIQANNSNKKYKDALTGDDSEKYKDRTKKYDTISIVSGIAAGSSIAFYLIYKQSYNRSWQSDKYRADIYMPDSQTIGLMVSVNF